MFARKRLKHLIFWNGESIYKRDTIYIEHDRLHALFDSRLWESSYFSLVAASAMVASVYLNNIEHFFFDQKYNIIRKRDQSLSRKLV
jgi:hypothetical protein